jgi:hypothetical protein
LNLKSLISNQVWGEGEGERAVYKKLKLMRKGDRTQTGMLSYNCTSKSFHTKSKTPMNKPAKTFKQLNILIIGLSAYAILPASVKAISSIVPSTAIPDKSAILMAQRQQQIKFKRGASSAELKGGVARGEVMIYLIGAKQGQRMNLEIQSVEGNAVFKVIDPNTNALAEEAKTWSGELPQTGKYQIVVGTQRGGASYTLSVSID